MAGILTRVTRRFILKANIWKILITKLILNMLHNCAVSSEDYTAMAMDEQTSVGQWWNDTDRRFFFFVIMAQSKCSKCTTAYRLIVWPLFPVIFRRSHFCRQVPPCPYEARDSSSEWWNCGWECWLVILPKCQLPRFHLGIFYVLQICDVGPWKTRGCQCSFRLLIIVASCWILLYELYYDAQIHKHQMYSNSVMVMQK
jgi:hypothetical protein